MGTGPSRCRKAGPAWTHVSEGALIGFGCHCPAVLHRPHGRHVPQDIAKSTDGEKAKLEQKLLRLQKSSWMCDYCGHVEELSRRLTEWTMKEVRRPLPSGGLPTRCRRQHTATPATSCDALQRPVMPCDAPSSDLSSSSDSSGCSSS